MKAKRKPLRWTEGGWIVVVQWNDYEKNAYGPVKERKAHAHAKHLVDSGVPGYSIEVMRIINL